MLLDYRIPIASWVEKLVRGIQSAWAAGFDGFADIVRFVINGLLGGLQAVPPLVLLAVLAALVTWKAGWKLGLFTAVGLFLIHNIQLWTPFLQTLSLVVTAQVLIVVVGVPLGILAASSDAAERIMRPILDFMQTMPAFVYLIPAVMFFGIGLVPGVVATFIFSLPPLVRLVNLGIRQVPLDLVEAADAFGATRLQKLVKVQVPQALPTMMAGLNQSIMLNLSMVVIAGMIGARGLGAEVLRGIQRIQVGQGFEAGLAVVILAIVLDRLTAAFAMRRRDGSRAREDG
ncbi:MAG: proline/glycine betaine ABC transporter permease [Trueperaceae bacterium]|nr:proline/glycine betaine ABC transporter permease [Trueperaceae bacterium]MCO5175277.1 proline/glycine betaine ABC transporter permease [Trueperaceae bacterium]MCW5819036.1 proline/glycine betaine ABC transporter permease [Trueperaceae bacterium]